MCIIRTKYTSTLMRWQLSLYYLLYRERPNFYVYGSFCALINSGLYIVSIRLASISTCIYRLTTVTNQLKACILVAVVGECDRQSDGQAITIFFVLNYWLTTAQFIAYCVQMTWLFTFRDLRMWQSYARTNERTDGRTNIQRYLV